MNNGRMNTLARALLCAAVHLTGAQPLAAQAARARAIVTVVDPSGAIVPDASVTLVALDPGAAASAIPPVKTTDRGIATVENLAPDRLVGHDDALRQAEHHGKRVLGHRFLVAAGLD